MGLSERRACTLLDVSRSGFRYERVKATADAPVLQRMKELALQYPRYGYRRIRIFLQREGCTMSAAKAWRLWHEAGLQIPRRRPRRRAATGRPRPLAPHQANQVWSRSEERRVGKECGSSGVP